MAHHRLAIVYVGRHFLRREDTVSQKSYILWQKAPSNYIPTQSTTMFIRGVEICVSFDVLSQRFNSYGSPL